MQHHSLLKTETEKDIFIDAIFAGMGEATSLLLCQIHSELHAQFGLSATALGKKAQMTPGGIIYHLRRLELKGYVHRNGHRSWIAGEKLVQLKRNMRRGNFVH